MCDKSCSNQVQFDPFKSSTFIDGGYEFYTSFGSGSGVDPVIDDDYTLFTRNATDTVSNGGHSATNISMYLITNQTAGFSIDPFSGTQGESKAETQLEIPIKSEIEF